MTNFVPSQTQSSIQTARGNFLQAILPPGTSIVQGQLNRVAEPTTANFVVMTYMRQDRLGTNYDTYPDCSFIAAAIGTALTVSSVLIGSLNTPTSLLGTNVAAGTQIVSQTSGTPGGIGVYALSAAQTLASGKFASGQVGLMQSLDVVFQLDVHGPNADSNATVISTFFRDQTAQNYWPNFSPGNLSPMYTSDPTQAPFINDQNQVEYRWVMDAHIGANIMITAPQEYADQLKAAINNPVDTFPT